MIAPRVIVGIGAGALLAAAAFAMPAVGAPDRVHRATSLTTSIATFFTPASADPKLAALIARSGFGATPFRFTPADSRNTSRHVVDVAIKAHSTTPGVVAPRIGGDVSAPSVGLAPIAYNLANSIAWKKFSLSGDLAKADLAVAPGSRKSDGSAIYSGRRAPARLTAHSDQPAPGATHLIGDVPSYSIDVGGSYSLTKNFDVTAGVRYKSQDRDQLTRLTSDTQDSRAVYVGTAFKF